MLSKNIGKGRAVIATLVACVAVTTLAGCSMTNPEGTFKKQLADRGFTHVQVIYGDSADGYTADVTAGKSSCQGFLYSDAVGNLTGRFTGTDDKQIVLKNPTSSLITAMPEFKYCA